MTVREMIDALRSQGRTVSYIERSDGGLRITKIDNVKFTGSKGNVYARAQLNIKLTEARAVQLTRINKKNAERVEGKRGGKVLKKSPLPAELVKDIRRVQRKWRKTHTTSEGFITTSKVRYILENKGMAEAKNALMQMERYASGLAYDDNIRYLEERLERFLEVSYNEKLKEALDKIRSSHASFKEEYISPIYEILYKAEQMKGALTEEYLTNLALKIMSILQ